MIWVVLAFPLFLRKVFYLFGLGPYLFCKVFIFCGLRAYSC